MSADGRTLVIGAAAMALLIAVGVVSAQLFARGGCASLPAPAEVVPAPAGSPASMLEAGFGGQAVDGARTIAALERLVGGEVTAVTPVGSATGLVAADGGSLAIGRRATALDADGGPRAALGLRRDDRVFGGGALLHLVAVADPATGQADSLIPFAATDLQLGECLDTAVVGPPFAFVLAADGPELLLLRIAPDGDRPELELRHAGQGLRWTAAVPRGFGPPSVLAERQSGGIGRDAVVTARRTSAHDDLPAVLVVSRADGSLRKEVAADVLAEAAGLDPAMPLRWEVVAVGSEVAFVTGVVDTPEAAGAGVLVAVPLDGGKPANASVPLPGRIVDAAVRDDRVAIATGTSDGEVELVVADGRSGASVHSQVGAAGEHASVAWLTPDRVAVGVRGGLVVVEGAEPRRADLGLDVLDLAVADERLLVLLRHHGSEQAVVVQLTFSTRR